MSNAGQVGDRFADPPERVPHDLTAFDRALYDAVSDRRPRELHHHIRGTRQERHAVDHVPDVEIR